MRLRLIRFAVVACTALFAIGMTTPNHAEACGKQRSLKKPCKKGSGCRKDRRLKKGKKCHKYRHHRSLHKKLMHIYAKKFAVMMLRLYKGMTQEQRFAYKRLKLQKKLDMPRFKARLHVAKADLRAAILAEQPNPKQIQAAINALVSAKAALITAKLGHFLKMRGMLKTEQQKRAFTMLWLKLQRAKRKTIRKVFAWQKKQHVLMKHALHKRWKKRGCKKSKGCKKGCNKKRAKKGCKKGCKKPCCAKKRAKKGCKKGCAKKRLAQRSCDKPCCKKRGWGDRGPWAPWARWAPWAPWRRWLGWGPPWARHCHKRRYLGCPKCRKHRRIRQMKRRRWRRQLHKFAHMMRAVRRFYRSLTPEQRKLKHSLRYDGMRIMLPLRARVRLERAILISMAMDTNITLKALQPQIQKLAQAKGALIAAKIKQHLRFYHTLNAHQKVQYGFLKLRHSKMKMHVKHRAMHMFYRFKRLIHHKIHKMMKRWKQGVGFGAAHPWKGEHKGRWFGRKWKKSDDVPPCHKAAAQAAAKAAIQAMIKKTAKKQAAPAKRKAAPVKKQAAPAKKK